MKIAFSTRLRRGLLALVAAVVALFLAFGNSVAQADQEYSPGYPKLGTQTEVTPGYSVKVGDKKVRTTLFTVHTSPNDAAIRAYCVELYVAVRYGVPMTVDGWDAFPGRNKFASDPDVRAKVAWIVSRSFPENSLQDVATRADAAGLTEQEAITATQLAIWHFTDGVSFEGLKDDSDGDIDRSASESVRTQKLYDYLVGSDNVGQSETTGPTVSATGPTEAGTAGSLVGPIRIESSVATASITGAPYPLVTADGAEVDLAAAPTGVDLFLQVPADAAAGSATLSVSVTGSMYSGKLLISTDPRSQTIIISNYRDITRQTELALSWNATPAPATTPPPSSPAPAPTPSPSEAHSTPVPSPSVTASTPTPTAPATKKPGLPKTGF